MIDEWVNRIRRRVERALPWFDVEAYHKETHRQEALLDDAQNSIRGAGKALRDYRKAHGERLLAEYERAERERGR